MIRSNGLIAAVCALALAPCLGGCAVAVVGGVAAAGGVGYEAAQERGINGEFDDVKVKTQIVGQLAATYGDISASVYAGRVLLTGTSPTPAQRAQAEQVVSQVPGVRTVFNEITVSTPETPGEMMQDGWITARVRSDLVFDADVRSGNYTIATDRGSVYLMGSARSQGELDRATQLARYVPGVQRVVSYVEIRSGEPIGTQPGPAQASAPPGTTSYAAPPPSGGYAAQPITPPAAGGYAGSTSSSSSSAPIQVQKLQ
jgi:osmotically-inducible protein OsmY